MGRTSNRFQFSVEGEMCGIKLNHSGKEKIMTKLKMKKMRLPNATDTRTRATVPKSELAVESTRYKKVAPG